MPSKTISWRYDPKQVVLPFPGPVSAASFAADILVMEKITLAFIVSEPVFNRGLGLLINELEGIELQKRSFEPGGLLRSGLSPDVILLDTGNDFGGDLKTAASLVDFFPLSKVLLLSNFDEPRYIASVKSIGAHGLLKKPVNKNQLGDAIKNLFQKGGTPGGTS